MTKKTGYGLIALTHLAGLEEGELASARGIARAYGIPQALLMNVLKELAAAGYIRSVRGARGGYSLVRSPEEIDFAGMTEALEGPIRFTACMDNRTDETCRIERCPILAAMQKAHQKIVGFLSNMTLADILQDMEPADRPVDTNAHDVRTTHLPGQ